MGFHLDHLFLRGSHGDPIGTHPAYQWNEDAVFLILLGLRDLDSVFLDDIHHLMRGVYSFHEKSIKQYFEDFLHDSTRSGVFYHDAEVWNTFIATRLIQFLMDPPR